MKTNPKVLIFVDFFSPGYRGGGQIRVIENALYQNSRCELKVVTTDRDLGDQQSYSDLALNTWRSFANAQVIYLSRQRQRLGALRALIADEAPDVIHLNSAFSARFTLPLLLARRFGFLDRAIRFIVSPHGELSPSALAQKSWKKNFFLRAAAALGLYRGVIWHVTSEREAAHLRNCLISNSSPVRIVTPALRPPTEPKFQADHDRNHSPPLRAISLSRICPVKNLEFALDVVSTYSGRLQFDIYGPIEAQDEPYWSMCREKIKSLPANIDVNYRGAVSAGDVSEVLSGYDVFLSPTLGENFGYSIIEAAASGCFVCVSPHTPWKDWPANAGVNIDLNSTEDWRQTLMKLESLTPAERSQRKGASRDFVKGLFNRQALFSDLYTRDRDR